MVTIALSAVERLNMQDAHRAARTEDQPEVRRLRLALPARRAIIDFSSIVFTRQALLEAKPRLADRIEQQPPSGA